MKPTPDQIEAWVDAAAAVHELGLEPTRRAAVIQVCSLLADMAAQVQAVTLTHADEPAPVYRLPEAP